MTPTPVLIIADRHRTARIEAVLLRDPTLRVVVVDAAALPGAEPESDTALVIVALPTPAMSRVLDTLRRWRRPPAIVLLSMAPTAAWSVRGRRAGVRAVLGQDASADEIAAAVTATRAGLLVVHPDALSRVPASSPVARGDARTLTTREIEVLEMMAEGMRNRAIAGRLKISRHTVKFHVASILTKLAARSRTEAVTLGVRHGLISL
jgi:two-component system, NarL family, response regulator YdfI